MYGEFIAKHRKLSGYKSQRQLALKSGISSATISRIESEEQKPLQETLLVLSKFLHTTSLVELMVVCGYWDEEDLLQPIDKGDPIGEAPSLYVTDSNAGTEKELADVISDLTERKLKYKGHALSDEQKKQFLKLIQTAAEMLDK